MFNTESIIENKIGVKEAVELLKETITNIGLSDKDHREILQATKYLVQEAAESAGECNFRKGYLTALNDVSECNLNQYIILNKDWDDLVEILGITDIDV